MNLTAQVARHMEEKPVSSDNETISEEARKRRRACNYEYKLDWPETEALAPESALYLSTRLQRARRLLSVSSRLNDEAARYGDVGLIYDFLNRAIKAVRSTLSLVLVANHEDAWIMVRLIVEACIRLAYLLKTGKPREFFEQRAFDLKERAHRMASVELVSPEEIDKFEDDMEEIFRHRLGSQKSQVRNSLNIEQMIKEVYGAESAGRMYLLYRSASAWAHPGVGGDDEFTTEARSVLGQTIQPWHILDFALEALDSLLDIAEPNLKQN